MDGISIVDKDSNIEIRVFPDELPLSAAEVTDELLSMFAPLPSWRNTAVEYFRQGMHDEFRSVLSTIVNEIDSQGATKDHYLKTDSFSQNMIEIFNALAADSLEKISCHKNHVKATVEFVKKAENIHALTPYTWIIKGFYELRQGDIRRAEDHFKNVSRQLQQYSFAAHVGLGITSFFRQRYAQALENFTKAITCHPGCNSTLRIAFAVCAFKLEQYERARAASEKAILMDSQSTKALVMLALLEMVSAQRDTSYRTEKRRNAFEYCILALQLDSTCSQALNIIANHYFHTWQVVGDGNHRAGTNQIVVSGAANLSIQELDPVQLNGSFLCRVKDIRYVDSDDVLITLNVDLPEDLKKIKFSVETKAYGQVRHLAQRALESAELPKVKADSLYFLGRLCHAQDEYTTALDYYGRALQFSPEMSLAAFGTGQLLLAQGRYRDAEINFRKVLSINPEDKDSQAYLVLLYSFLQQELVAFDKIREVSVGFPYEVDLWLIQAQLRFMSAIELPTSLRMLEVAISLLEKQDLHVCTELYLNLSVVHSLVGNKDKAYFFSRKGLSQLISATDAKSRVWGFKCAENDVFWTWSDNFTAIFNLSENTYDVHDTRSKLLLSQEIVEGDEIIVDGSFVLTVTRSLKDGSSFCGSSYITVPDGTTVSCKRKVPRIAFDDENICYFFNHARILEGMGSDCAAEELYYAILSSHPSFIDCYLRLGQISLKRGNFDAACSLLMKALNIDGDNVDANITLGDFYVSKSKWVEAKVSYEKANGRTEATQDSRAMVSLGNMYIANLGTSREDNLKLSYKFYHHILNKDNLNVFAAVGLGMVCSEKKLFEVARDIFSRIRESSVVNVTDNCINLANVYLTQNRATDAIHMYQSALKSAENSYQAMERVTSLNDCLAAAYLRSKHFNEASSICKKVIHLNPTMAHSWFNISLVREENAVDILMRSQRTVKDIEEAMSEFKAASSVFQFLTHDRSNCVVGKSSLRCSKTKAIDHKIYCDQNLSKAEIHLQKAYTDMRKEETLRIRQEEMHRQIIEAKQHEKFLKEEEEERIRQEKNEKALKANEKLGSLREKWVAPTPSESNRKSKKSTTKPYLKSSMSENSSDDEEQVSQGPVDRTVTKRSRDDIFDSSESSSEEDAAGSNTSRDKFQRHDDDDQLSTPDMVSNNANSSQQRRAIIEDDDDDDDDDKI